MKGPYQILLVGDEPETRSHLQVLLDGDACRVETARDGLRALERVRREPVPDLVFLEALLSDPGSLETLKRLRKARPGLKIIMLSGTCLPRIVTEALRLGALDFLSRPVRKSELDDALKRVLVDPGAGGNETGAGFHVEDIGDDTTLAFSSRAMEKVREQAAKIASADVPVLLLGESGTGKGVVARLIHAISDRARGTFLKVNCAALPSELLESELFGYEAGAFTGATKSKPGKFELADKGTILLDEIGDMPIGLQAKLLHVLQDQQFFRLGGRSSIRVNVRVVAATNIDIKEAVASARIRADLYYRLNAFTIHLPPLRERKEEIAFLMKHFMVRFAADYGRQPRPFSDRLLESANNYPWPGNIRELENFVKRYLIIGNEKEAMCELAGIHPNTQNPSTGPRLHRPIGSTDLKSLVGGLKSGAEARAITDILDQTNWNRKETARRLNISYKALLNKIRKYSLDRDADPPVAT